MNAMLIWRYVLEKPLSALSAASTVMGLPDPFTLVFHWFAGVLVVAVPRGATGVAVGRAARVPADCAEKVTEVLAGTTAWYSKSCHTGDVPIAHVAV
jgi:hypothetical protein